MKLNVKDSTLEVYIALKSLYNNSYEQCDITIDMIGNIIYKKFKLDSNTDRHKIKKIENGILELSKNNYITILKKDKKRYLLDISNLYTNGLFAEFYLEDIMNTNQSVGVIRYLIYLLSLKNDNGGFFFYSSRESMSSITGYSIRTIDKYNKILQSNNIIYIKQHNYKYTDSNKDLCNAYGLYENKDIIDNICNEYIKSQLDRNIIINK